MIAGTHLSPTQTYPLSSGSLEALEGGWYPPLKDSVIEHSDNVWEAADRSQTVVEGTLAQKHHRPSFAQVRSDPHLQTYDDRTWLDKHFAMEGMTDVEDLAQYNFAPTLDEDVITTQQNIAYQVD